MRTILFFCFVLGCSAFAKAQSIDSVLKKYNSVPYISVEELKMDYDNYLILDTREKEEYDVSHLPNAIWAGKTIKDWKKHSKHTDKKVVVYCTIGVRSEDYGEELQAAGFQNVKNLYGSIFAWKNAGYTVVDAKGKPTENVHTYSRTWAKYLKSGNKVTSVSKN